MFEEPQEEVSAFDFDEIAGHLLEQGSQVSPSRIHGCLCGLLCGGAPVQAEYGLDALVGALDLVAHGELANRIMQLYTVTDAVLRDEEFTFFPLLPDDDVEIDSRTEALADWCSGFLAGVAYAAAGEEESGKSFNELSSEALRDIAALAQAEATDDEFDDEGEENYIELVEYLRVAVVNIYMDFDTVPREPGAPNGNGGALH